MTDKRVVAVFDFDGTITYRDSLLPFLNFTYGPSKTYGKLLLQAPALIGFALGVIKRQQVKEAILRPFFKGECPETLMQLGKKYASEKLDTLVRPAAKQRLEWHQNSGHHCILASASLDIYLVPWAQAAGFQDVICSRLEVSKDKKFTGRLEGANCWGPEKKRRLEQLCGPRDQYTLYAYGDSRGDREILDMADCPFFKSMG